MFSLVSCPSRFYLTPIFVHTRIAVFKRKMHRGVSTIPEASRPWPRGVASPLFPADRKKGAETKSLLVSPQDYDNHKRNLHGHGKEGVLSKHELYKIQSIIK